MSGPGGPWGPRGDAAAVDEWPDGAPPGPALDAAASQYPCASCGATIAYAPGETVLHCAFCGADTPIPRAAPDALREALRERDFEAALRGAADAAPSEETQVVACDSCGARVEFDRARHADRCPFCATPLVADPAPDRHIRPQALLPFAIRGEEAQEGVRRWLAGLWFAPRGLARFARAGAALEGVYTPYWTFDARAETVYAGMRGDAYTVQRRGPNNQIVTETRIRWTPARGRLTRAFDDVLTPASRSLPAADLDALAPWDLSRLAPYARDWLAGFRAEAYTVDLREGWAAARREIDAAILSQVRRAIGGDQQRVERVDTRLSDVTFKHVLLPVWVGAYRWRGRAWRVIVNGRTGAVRGERPWSVWKIALAVALAAAAVGLALWLAAQEGGLPAGLGGGVRLGY